MKSIPTTAGYMITVDFGLSTGGNRNIVYKLYTADMKYLGDCNADKAPLLHEIAKIKGKSYREYISENGKPQFSYFGE